MRRWYFGSHMSDCRKKLLVGAVLASSKIRGKGLDTLRYPHPWFDACEQVPWHVILRLGTLLDTPRFYNPFISPTAFSPYSVAPLYSQPVIEILLRIPLYILFRHGHERGLAREAFRQDVPEAILRRQWKDRAPGAFENLVRRNRAFMYDTLIGGALCREGLLDRDAMQSALSGNFSTSQFFVGELMNYLDLELWLRPFVDKPINPAGSLP